MTVQGERRLVQPVFVHYEKHLLAIVVFVSI
jgi:hypothetical protein